MQVVADRPDQITWRVEQGPDSWIDTLITFTLRPHRDKGTTLLFTHAGWQEVNEFMSGCSTNWGSYPTSLKTGAEKRPVRAIPAGRSAAETECSLRKRRLLRSALPPASNCWTRRGSFTGFSDTLSPR